MDLMNKHLKINVRKTGRGRRHRGKLLALALVIGILAAGCGKEKTTEQESAKTAQGQESAAETGQPETLPEDQEPQTGEQTEAAGEEPLDQSTANLELAVVLRLTEEGAVVRPVLTEETEEGSVAAFSLEEDAAEDINLIFTENTKFQKQLLSAATGSVTDTSAAAREDVKEDANVQVWGTYEGENLIVDQLVIEEVQ